MLLFFSMHLGAQQHASGRLEMFVAKQHRFEAQRREHANVTVAAMQGWTDTGLLLLAGETLHCKSKGDLTFAGGRTAHPDGIPRGWRDMLRRFPVDTADVGTLVGRIGESEAAVPFVLGTATDVKARSSGRLFVRANMSSDELATGAYTLELRVSKAAASAMVSTENESLLQVSLAALDALPRRVTDERSHFGDALNFALLGTEQQVRSALADAGWFAVDADSDSAVLHGLLNTLQHKPYLEVPMSPLYLFGRVQDLSYARASALIVAKERHHLRCWKTELTVAGQPLWIGAATHDIGFERDERSGQLTHRIAPEIDLERDFLRDTLLESGAAASVAYYTPLDPVRAARTATGGAFQSDGRMVLLRLQHAD